MLSLLFQTSASLKFTVLNPKGRIWTMVAGGGASVIYADTVSTSSFHVSKIILTGFHVGAY
jgi:succinyl-CoA synthetase beta subunit